MSDTTKQNDYMGMTDANKITEALQEFGHTYGELANRTGLNVDWLHLLVAQMKKMGKVVESEEGMLRLVKATESPQDARMSWESHTHTTSLSECSTGEVKLVADDAAYYEAADKAQCALDSLVGAYAAANLMLIGLRAENKTLRLQVDGLIETMAEWKSKLQEMVK